MYHFASVDNIQIVGGDRLAAQAAMVAFSGHGISSSSDSVSNASLPDRSASAEMAI